MKKRGVWRLPVFQRTMLQMTYWQHEKCEVNVEKHEIDEKQLHVIFTCRNRGEKTCSNNSFKAWNQLNMSEHKHQWRFQIWLSWLFSPDRLCTVIDENKGCIHSLSKRSSLSEEALKVKKNKKSLPWVCMMFVWSFERQVCPRNRCPTGPLPVVRLLLLSTPTSYGSD